MSKDQASSNRVGADPAGRAGRGCEPTHRWGPGRRISAIVLGVTTVLGVGSAAAEATPTTVVPAVPFAPVGVAEPGDVTAAADRGPDQVAESVGGIAARLRRTDGSLAPGRLYLLMATVGSDERARLYDQTPYSHDNGAHADTIGSNERAVEAAEWITGLDIERIDFTTAPGGGPSAGVLYLIAYLNVVSDGAFTADLSVAATGELGAEGYIGHVTGIDEKLAASDLAGADVFLTPSAPSHPKLAEHADRHAGHVYRSRDGRVPLTSERGLDDYETWGADRPDGLDVVEVGHIADVAAYFCGAGSEYACSIADLLGATITSDTLSAYDLARAAPAPAAAQATIAADDGGLR